MWNPTTPAEKRLATAFQKALAERVERVARAMYDAECEQDGNIICWEDQTPIYLTRLRIMALAAITEIDNCDTRPVKRGTKP